MLNKKHHTTVVFTANIVGGHELMMIEHIENCHQDGMSILCYVPEDNTLLSDILTSKRIKFSTHNVLHKKMEILHSFLNPIHIYSIFSFFKKIDKSSGDIIIVQGDIELGSGFILVSKFLRNNIISYIPYTHEFGHMGSKGAVIKDFLSKFVYRSCDNYWTICKHFAEQLKLKNKKANVSIIENFVKEPPINEIRGRGYEFIQNNKILTIMMAGRIFFRQKGQDCLIEAIKKIKTTSHIRLKIIGDGPDAEKLKKLTKTLSSKVETIYYGWKENIWEHSRDVDFIVIPSNYEGVPLIMLEALKRNVPVIAANRDGMKDYLEDSSLFEVNCEAKKSVNLARKISEFAIINSKEGFYES